LKILLTGATGLVGAHTAMELMRAGHDLCLLVRDPQLAAGYFRARGWEPWRLVTADMRDRDAVRAALSGCDAVFHAAAMVSVDPRKADALYRTNLESMDAVIGTAFACGVPNIVYVSSVGALFNPRERHLDERSPLGVAREAYARSKRDCEACARRLQARGAPIQITYPCGVFGPDDPRLNESSRGLMALLRVVPRTSSGIQFVDARDLAVAHRRLLETPPNGDPEEARYVVAGPFHTWPQFRALLERVTERRIFSPVVPGVLLRAFGRVLDLVRVLYPVTYPISAASTAVVTQWSVADSSHIARRFGIGFRPGEETIADTVRWLFRAGRVSRRLAGALAHSNG
jgi:dihydroflavonol-4-reductase